jgi:hypothetical protein
LQLLVGLDHKFHRSTEQTYRPLKLIRIGGRRDQAHDDDHVRAQCTRHIDGEVSHQTTVGENLLILLDRRKYAG